MIGRIGIAGEEERLQNLEHGGRLAVADIPAATGIVARVWYSESAWTVRVSRIGYSALAKNA